MTSPLRVLHLHGINTDSLGQYLVGLGVLSAASQKWPDIRACWKDGHFVLLSEGVSQGTLEGFLRGEWQPTRYQRWWSEPQKKDTKAKSSAHLWHERNQRPMTEVRVLDAHIVPVARNQFNPVLGTGGNVGKRDLAKAWNDSRRLLNHPNSSAWLHGTLSGEQSNPLPDLASGGTWFVYANKTFNSGQGWYREGQLSPWSFLLAMEGTFLLVGGVNRRLSARARPYAVFPFISEPSPPESSGEVGMAKGEFWAPLWVWPATIQEARSLFQRGLAKCGGRSAKSPHEFAVAALSAGVDAGITEFARFELRQTTSSQVYEAIPRPHIAIGMHDAQRPVMTLPRPESNLLINLIESGWLDRLPFEPRRANQRGKFIGLRGPIETALIRIGELPDDPERWQNLLLRLAAAQTRIDANKDLRDRCRPLPLLAGEWFDRAWPIGQRPDEIEMAAAIASVGAGTAVPFLISVFGVDVRAKTRGERKLTFQVRFSAARPQRVVWNKGDPIRVLIDVAHRRLVDAVPSDAMLVSGAYCCRARLIDRLLSGDPTFDLELVAKWVPALSLVDWHNVLARQYRGEPTAEPPVADGMSLLDGLFRPFFQRANIAVHGRLLFGKEGDSRRPTPAFARRLFNLICQQSVEQAVELAQSRYIAVQCPTIGLPTNVTVDAERLAAALLVPMDTTDMAGRFRRWVESTKNLS